MSEALNSCPKCSSFDIKIIKEINPNTSDVNMSVLLKCNKLTCEHEWQGFQTSHSHNYRRMRGWYI
jgi:hypothetical protein